MIPSVSMPVDPRSCPRRKSKVLTQRAQRTELSASLSEYALRDKVGSGAFGQVYVAETLGRGHQRSKHVALKVIRRKNLVKDSTKRLAISEIDNLKHLSSTGSMFFTQLVDAFHDDHNLYIVTVSLILTQNLSSLLKTL